MRKYVWIGPILLSLCLCTFKVWAQQDTVLIKGKLKNGLSYYIYPNAFPKGETVYRLFLKSGSLSETENQRGLAHFLEHMAFNGTRHFPGDSLIRYLEGNGAKFGSDLNAHTSYNETVYKLQLPSKDSLEVDKTLSILRDWASELSFDSLEIEQERGVVLSEWLSKRAAHEQVEEAFLNKLLNGSRFAHRKVIGDTSVIKHFKRQELMDYYQRWYSPELMAVAVVGDVSPAQVERLIREKFKDLPRGKHKQAPSYTIDNYTHRSFEQVINAGETQAELNLIQLFKKDGPVNNAADYQAYLQRALLQTLLRKRFADLSFTNPAYVKASFQFSSFLNTKKVVMGSLQINPEQIRKSIRDYAVQLAQIYQQGFLDLEIHQAKQSYKRALKTKVEQDNPTPSLRIMDDIYQDFYQEQMLVDKNAEYQWFLEREGRIDSVSLMKSFKALFKPEKIQYMLSAYPDIKDEMPDSTWVYQVFDQTFAEKQPAYSLDIKTRDQLLKTLPEKASIVKETYIKALEATRISLSNGVDVILKKPQNPNGKIAISGFRKGGLYALDSADYITGQYATHILAISGAGDFSRESLSYYLNSHPASLRFVVDKTRSGLAGSADTARAENLFQLLYLKWTAPRIDTTNFNLIKEKAISQYRNTVTTKANDFQRDLNYLVNGADYTTRPTTDTLLKEALKAERVIPVFNRSFGHANGYTFVISADMDEALLKEWICRYLGGLPSGETHTGYIYQRPALARTRKIIREPVSKSPKASVTLITQQTRLPEDIHVYNLKQDILADVLRMKLQQRLREQMGMVYSVGVSASATPYPSPLSRQRIAFSCEPDNVEHLSKAIRELLEEVARNPQSFTQELADIKTNLLKEMELNKQRDSFWSSYIRNTLFYQIDNWNYLQDFPTILEKITPEEIARICREDYLEAEQFIEAVMLPEEKQKKVNN